MSEHEDFPAYADMDGVPFYAAPVVRRDPPFMSPAVRHELPPPSRVHQLCSIQHLDRTMRVYVLAVFLPDLFAEDGAYLCTTHEVQRRMSLLQSPESSRVWQVATVWPAAFSSSHADVSTPGDRIPRAFRQGIEIWDERPRTTDVVIMPQVPHTCVRCGMTSKLQAFIHEHVVTACTQWRAVNQAETRQARALSYFDPYTRLDAVTRPKPTPTPAPTEPPVDDRCAMQKYVDDIVAPRMRNLEL